MTAPLITLTDEMMAAAEECSADQSAGWIGYLIGEILAQRAQRDDQSAELAAVRDLLAAEREARETAERELRELNEALAEREKWRSGNFGSCVICGGTIFHTDGLIEDERGTMHPLCQILRRAETAEAELAVAVRNIDAAIAREDAVCPEGYTYEQYTAELRATVERLETSLKEIGDEAERLLPWSTFVVSRLRAALAKGGDS